jgi:hypothetical protein
VGGCHLVGGLGEEGGGGLLVWMLIICDGMELSEGRGEGRREKGVSESLLRDRSDKLSTLWDLCFLVATLLPK